MIIYGRIEGLCHSLAVHHGMRCDETTWQNKGLYHSHPNGHWHMRCDETAWQKGGTVAHTPPVGHGIRLSDRREGHCHSLSVGHGMRCDEIPIQNKRVVFLTS